MRSWATLASEILHHTGKDACPELPDELLLVQAAHGRLGTDANGRALKSEMREWWDDHEVRDPGTRDAYEALWRAIEGEEARVHWEQLRSKPEK